MNLVKRLYELQSIDLEIKKTQTSLEGVVQRLGDSNVLIKAKTDLAEITGILVEIGRQKKELEWDINELRKNISQINVKLYGGNVKNPKELMSLEREAIGLKSKLRKSEDDLLDLMGNEEQTQEKKRSADMQLKEVEIKWQTDQDILINQKSNLEEQIDNLNKQRQDAISGVDNDSLKIYDRIATRKGYAVVRVEQGRCQGCRLSLSMSEMQRARSGVLVQCSSCGMVLYLG